MKLVRFQELTKSSSFGFHFPKPHANMKWIGPKTTGFILGTDPGNSFLQTQLAVTEKKKGDIINSLIFCTLDSYVIRSNF